MTEIPYNSQFYVPRGEQPVIPVYSGQETYDFPHLTERPHLLRERAVEHLVAEANRPDISVVNIEGSPMYIWPHPQRPVQHWGNLAFRKGWEVTRDLAQRLPADKTNHWALVDDYNNRPEGADLGGISVEDAMRTILGDLDISGEINTIGFWESRFEVEGGRNQCSNLDAAFQRTKFVASRDATLPGQIPLMIVVHPLKFQDQQWRMLGNLLGEFKSPPLNEIPRKERQSLIERTYRHLWLDKHGQVASYTQPEWDGNRFNFREVSII